MVKAVKDVIPLVLASKTDWRNSLAREWHLIVGTLATRTCLEKIYDDTVVIGVYESHWMQELYLLSSDIKDLINSMLQVPHIKHVRFKLVEERTKNVRVLYPKKMKRPESAPLNTSQVQALSRIKDEALRNALSDFWARCTMFQEKG